MTLLLGHSNMDADCIGSILLARYLYPEAIAVKSSRLHPLARRLLMLDEEEMGLVKLGEIDLKSVDSIVVVDTHSSSQVAEFTRELPKNLEIHAIDHHIHVTEPLAGTLHLRPYGANCSVLCELLCASSINVDADTATLALAGIYADTGNFTHDNVCEADFAAAQYLVQCGANIRVVRNFTNRLPDDNLMNLFHDLSAAYHTVEICGVNCGLASIEVGEQVPGLALLVERVHEFQQSDASFCIFTMPREDSTLIIARSSSPQVDLAYILAPFGGGGHAQAASALVKKSSDVPIRKMLERTIETRMGRGNLAVDFMMENPPLVYDTWTLLDAAIYLENQNVSGAPVMGAGDILMGMLSLRDIQKARKSNSMQSPVKAFMSRKLHTVETSASARDIEAYFLKNDINKLPVMDKGLLVGLISRSDFLKKQNQ